MGVVDFPKKTEDFLRSFNIDHDLIYGAYKISEINEKMFCRGYNNINMKQLLCDIYVQNWNYIHASSDPEQQI
jgi:hypothetical protein